MTLFDPHALRLGPQTVADSLTREGNAPAALVSIFDGTRFASAASGVSEQGGAAARPNQSFEVGSQTKMMTALVVLQLVEEGRLDLDRPFADYLDPALVEGVANADVATVGQALEMRTGILNYTEIERPDGTSLITLIDENPDEIMDAEEIVQLLEDLPASAPPGTQYEYSNANYFYLGAVIEAVTGQALGTVFAERIFEPLGMTDTFLNDFRDDPRRLSSYLEIDGTLYDVTSVLVDAGAEGGVVSTVADMTTFLRALLVDRTLGADSVLARMTDFDAGSLDPRGFTFNAGLVSLEIDGLGTFVGFSGGTLGTDSATYLHVESGRIVSAAITQSNLDVSATGGVLFAASLTAQDPAWKTGADGDSLRIEGVSAAELRFASEDGVTTLRAESASIELDGHLRCHDEGDFDFADGSRLEIGTRSGDTLRAGRGDDQLLGFGGDDILDGRRGDDRILGGSGDDRLIGRAGEDALFGQGGTDLLFGGAGDDMLRGGRGADRLVGGIGDDILRGGRGEDRLVGGAGSDRLTGGQGADVFVFRATDRNETPDLDVITDFEIGIDRLALRGRAVVEVERKAEGLALTLDGDGDRVLLLGVEDAEALALL